MSGAVGAATQRQGRSKIATETTMEKFVNHYCGLTNMLQKYLFNQMN